MSLLCVRVASLTSCSVYRFQFQEFSSHGSGLCTIITVLCRRNSRGVHNSCRANANKYRPRFAKAVSEISHASFAPSELSTTTCAKRKRIWLRMDRRRAVATKAFRFLVGRGTTLDYQAELAPDKQSLVIRGQLEHRQAFVGCCRAVRSNTKSPKSQTLADNLCSVLIPLLEHVSGSNSDNAWAGHSRVSSSNSFVTSTSTPLARRVPLLLSQYYVYLGQPSAQY